MNTKINLTGCGFIHPITKEYIAPGHGYDDFAIVDIQAPCENFNQKKSEIKKNYFKAEKENKNINLNVSFQDKKSKKKNQNTSI